MFRFRGARSAGFGVAVVLTIAAGLSTSPAAASSTSSAGNVVAVIKAQDQKLEAAIGGVHAAHRDMGQFDELILVRQTQLKPDRAKTQPREGRDVRR
jgi:hypothetical protein